MDLKYTLFPTDGMYKKLLCFLVINFQIFPLFK